MLDEFQRKHANFTMCLDLSRYETANSDHVNSRGLCNYSDNGKSKSIMEDAEAKYI